MLPGRHPELAAKQLASSNMPAHVKKRAAAICTRMIHAKFENFVNRGNRSNIKNVAPDPGICIRVKFAAAQARAGFFNIRSNAGQDAADRRNGGPAGELFSPAIYPA